MIKQNERNNSIYTFFNILKEKIIFYIDHFRNKNRKIKLFIFIIFLIICICLFLYKLFFIDLKEIKVCLCAIGKRENLYVREYVEHYKLYGVNKIFIYDNNEIDGEVFDNILSDYISNEFVEIINYRGKKQVQLQMLNDCYNRNYEKYDWFIMFDMDEFIYLKNHINIKTYLKRIEFRKYEVIYFFRACHTDNNHLHYENKSLFERFPQSVYNVLSVKPILRGHYFNITIDNIHIINWNIKYCYSFGEKKVKKMDFKNYFIDHFYYKSTEEFINKINRGDAYFNDSYGLRKGKIGEYLVINNMTLEKINYIEKETKINLTDFRQKLINNQ